MKEKDIMREGSMLSEEMLDQVNGGTGYEYIDFNQYEVVNLHPLWPPMENKEKQENKEKPKYPLPDCFIPGKGGI